MEGAQTEEEEVYASLEDYYLDCCRYEWVFF
jgi:hypothetical protein